MHIVETLIERRLGGNDDEQEFITSIALLTGIAMTVIGMLFHLTGLVGIQAWIPLAISGLMMASALIALALFLWTKIRVNLLIDTWGGGVMQLFTSLRIVIVAYSCQEQAAVMIIVNIAISLTIELFLAFSLHPMPTIITALTSITCMVVSWVIAPDQIRGSLVITFTFMQVMVAIYCILGAQYVQEKNERLLTHIETEDRLLRIIGMSRSELMALIQACRNNKSDRPLDEAVTSHLSERTKRGLINTAQQLQSIHHDALADIKRLFPQLTPTEADICRQVAMGKTLNEIASITGKSPSNVSTVRGNIRRKLGLTSGTDLRTYLSDVIKHHMQPK